MYKKLQNGSDIRGIAITTDAAERNLTPEAMRAIGAGFMRFLRERLPEKAGKPLSVAIGHDSRITAKELFTNLAEGMMYSEPETDIVYTRLSSTPAMFMSTVLPGHEYDAGVMITASHLPYDRNGVKFFLKTGGLEKADIAKILEYAGETEVTVSTPLKFRAVDLMSDYAEALKKVIRDAANLGSEPLSGLHILVDAGNGAGGFFAEKVLMPLGADVSGSLYLEPDGTFPNHAPNPEDKNAMVAISEAVVRYHADLGIIFDTDVDRAALVFPDGSPINRNRLIALMSAVTAQKYPGATIVTDSVTSTGLSEFIESLGLKHRRFKRGYRNVINEAVRLNNDGICAPLAIETSGHGALMDNYFLDDGAYMACLLTAQAAAMRAEGKELSSLTAALSEPAEAREIRIDVTVPDHAAYSEGVLRDLEKAVAEWENYSIDENNCEGIRANFSGEYGSGWFLLRISLHDPVLPLNIECDKQGGCDRVFSDLSAFFAKYSALKLNGRSF